VVPFSNAPHNIVEHILFGVLVYTDAPVTVLTISMGAPSMVRDYFLGAPLMQLTYFLKEVIFSVFIDKFTIQ
jgi:hypothetical protein